MSQYAPFGWTGLYLDDYTGKYHAHHRDYSPIHARWLSEDPAGYADGMNLYAAYMGVNGRDPSGLNTEVQYDVIGKAVYVGAHLDGLMVPFGFETAQFNFQPFSMQFDADLNEGRGGYRVYDTYLPSVDKATGNLKISGETWREATPADYNLFFLEIYASKVRSGEYRQTTMMASGTNPWTPSVPSLYLQKANIEWAKHQGKLGTEFVTSSAKTFFTALALQQSFKFVGNKLKKFKNKASSATINSKSISRTNYDLYESLAEFKVSGKTRSSHRRIANKQFFQAMDQDPVFRQQMNKLLGTDVMLHMQSGKGKQLINPPGTVWHHPIENPNTLRLLLKDEHTNPLLQKVLHPGPNGTGGFGEHFGG